MPSLQLLEEAVLEVESGLTGLNVRIGGGIGWALPSGIVSSEGGRGAWGSGGGDLKPGSSLMRASICGGILLWHFLEVM